MIIRDLDYAVVPLDQCGTGFDPVAAIVIGDRADLADRRAMNMTAQNSIDRKLLGVAHNLFFKSADETDRILHPLLRVGAERPVTETEPSADKIDERIKREQKLVAKVTEKRQPL